MNAFPDLVELFGFSLNPLELVVRGSALYWFLFVLFRFGIRRDVGSIAIADILLLVLIADASQNAMAGEYRSVSDGFVLVATLAGWNYLVDWCSYRFPAVRRLVEAKPLLLVEEGRLLRKNMRREFITTEELESKLREAGVASLAEVRRAYLESDGEISLLLDDDVKPKPLDPPAADKRKPKSPPPTGLEPQPKKRPRSPKPRQTVP